MRKSTLKHGLNVRKPVATTPAKNDGRSAPKSVFAFDELETAAEALQTTYAGGSEAQKSAKLALDLESSDPSVFAYDEVYDKINLARSRLKPSNDLKPRYMEKLLETAENRKVQNEVVKERLLAKQREREGDVFADKETIVTESYREHKEQRQKMVDEENEREKEEEKGRGRLDTGFYRELLDRMDRDDVSKAVDTVDAVDCVDTEPVGPVVLGSGLNIVSSQSSRRHDQPTPHGPRSSTNSNNESMQSNRQSAYRRNKHGRSVDDEMNEMEQLKMAQQQVEQQKLVQRYARRNTQADIDAARLRYLERRQLAT
ncbi:Nuclear speckle splicing regulatory protein 1, partial [Coemansia sp. RSA 532]